MQVFRRNVVTTQLVQNRNFSEHVALTRIVKPTVVNRQEQVVVQHVEEVKFGKHVSVVRVVVLHDNLLEVEVEMLDAVPLGIGHRINRLVKVLRENLMNHKVVGKHVRQEQRRNHGGHACVSS